MKTPKRDYKKARLCPATGDLDEYHVWEEEARWKRKNRVAQLKRTIAKLADFRRKHQELWLGGKLKKYSPEWDAFILLRRLETPAEDASADEKFEYWIQLREVGKCVLNAACLAAKNYGKAEEKENAACHPETAENGQQTELPPAGGQQPCIARNAENATQNILPCTDAEQLTNRKGN